MVARNDDSVGGFLFGPTLAHGVACCRLTHVQVRLVLCILCCGGLLCAIAAETHLDGTQQNESVRMRGAAGGSNKSHLPLCSGLNALIHISENRKCRATLMSTALGRPPFFIQGWTSISSFFCSSEKRGCFFCRSRSFSLSSLSTIWMSLQTQHIRVKRLRPTIEWNASLWDPYFSTVSNMIFNYWMGDDCATDTVPDEQVVNAHSVWLVAINTWLPSSGQPAALFAPAVHHLLHNTRSMTVTPNGYFNRLLQIIYLAALPEGKCN